REMPHDWRSCEDLAGSRGDVGIVLVSLPAGSAYHAERSERSRRTCVTKQGTILKYVYELERNRRDELWFTQPLGGGRVKTYTFGEAIDEARRVAAFLDEMKLEKGSKIILCSKNTAWW